MVKDIPKKIAIIILILAVILSIAGTWMILASGPVIVGGFISSAEDIIINLTIGG